MKTTTFGAEFLGDMDAPVTGSWADASVSGERYLDSLDHRLAGGFDCVFC